MGRMPRKAAAINRSLTPVQRKILAKFTRPIKQGRLHDAGILCDWLEEIRHPQADKCREAWIAWDRMITRLMNGTERIRRRWSLADEVGVHHCVFRAALLHHLCDENLVKRWSLKAIRTAWDENRAMTPLPKIQADEDGEETVTPERPVLSKSGSEPVSQASSGEEHGASNQEYPA